MKNLFTILIILFTSHFIQAQCSDIFISEYVEGTWNNKALELYNPTENSIDLSAYTIARYKNGSQSASAPLQLSGTILPYSTIVLGLDKREENGTGLEAPMWDGYYTFVDSICPETFGQEITIYNIESDLQSLINLWANGVYYNGTDPEQQALYPQTLFFNGNDAIVLSSLSGGLVDVFGQVGFNPGEAWTDANGSYWTQDQTLIRKPDITGGFMANPNPFDPTLEWDSLPVNTFVNLGSHNCTCDPNYTNSNIFGCTNQNALNYNPSANIDDHSCEYDECDTSLLEQKNVLLLQNSSNGRIQISNDLIIKNVSIYNEIGKLVLSKKVSNLKHTEVSVGNKRGIFFVSIEDTDGLKTKSILVK